MENNIAIPQIPYVVFELVKINVDRYISNQDYKAEQVQTVYLAVLPEQFNYRLTSRDAIRQTDSKVFVNKYGLAPERCTISGNFGQKSRLIAGTYMDGWSRLKQFEELIVRKGKETEFTQDGSKYIYALNYYDFLWQRYGNINIQSFSVNGNSRVNALLPFYSCDFMIIGELIDVYSKDLLLEGLLLLFGNQSVLNNLLEGLSDIMDVASPVLTGIQAGSQAYSLITESVELFNSTGDFLSNLSNNTYNDVASLF